MRPTVDDIKTAVMDIYSALNVVYEGCPATTRRWVFEQAVNIMPRRYERAGGWSDFTLQELRECASLLRQRHEKTAVAL